MTDWPRHARQGHPAALPSVGIPLELRVRGLMGKGDEFLAVSRKISFPDDFPPSPPKVN